MGGELVLSKDWPAPGEAGALDDLKEVSDRVDFILGSIGQNASLEYKN